LVVAPLLYRLDDGMLYSSTKARRHGHDKEIQVIIKEKPHRLHRELRRGGETMISFVLAETVGLVL